MGGNLTGSIIGKADYILVVAASARMLVQAANKAGFKPLAIDLWGDQDTRSYAVKTQQVPSLAEQYLLPAIENLISKYPVKSICYGGGFESYINSLRSVGSRLALAGNQPEVFARLHDKPAFFSLLQSLQIPYPEVSFCLPNQSEGWLLKPIYGQGGIGIKRFQLDDSIVPSVYWQKYKEGVPHSVLFLADGKRSQVIGFNRQWTVPLSEKDEFIFSGIINSTSLSDGQKNQVRVWLDCLVPKLTLKGLNSLDFIQSGATSFVLEINPRPPASMQLYDADLFIRHIEACQGQLSDCKISQDGYTAYQIVYAKQNTLIRNGIKWPEGAADIPQPNTLIGAGQPICSIIARGTGPQEALERLQEKQKIITNQLDRF